ncbi:hypothetical protein M413DRAFT_390693 [Hebeloma cylindrosporum]|uniref:Uncharacterized protein n=1 Tax=Hebeloma cylindrosporum TaxID=76867 RepID=A0A0C2YS65_HEBCY|nr:hypothetical protein M413DRAFT_390693 [Hebeloma cylindrosporum h7]
MGRTGKRKHVRVSRPGNQVVATFLGGIFRVRGKIASNQLNRRSNLKRNGSLKKFNRYEQSKKLEQNWELYMKITYFRAYIYTVTKVLVLSTSMKSRRNFAQKGSTRRYEHREGGDPPTVGVPAKYNVLDVHPTQRHHRSRCIAGLPPNSLRQIYEAHQPRLLDIIHSPIRSPDLGDRFRYIWHFQAICYSIDLTRHCILFCIIHSRRCLASRQPHKDLLVNPS